MKINCIFEETINFKTMKATTNLVSKEKKQFILKEYIGNYGVSSEYDLVMYLLDDSLFEQGDVSQMIEVCEFVFADFYKKMNNDESKMGYSIKLYVTEAHEDWIENNYGNDYV